MSTILLEPPAADTAARMERLDLGESPAAALTARLESESATALLPPEEVARLRYRLNRLQSEVDGLYANAAAMAAEPEATIARLLEEHRAELLAWIVEENPEAKSRRDLFGMIGTRTTGGKPYVADEAAALAYAREHCPGAIVSTEVVDWELVRARCPEAFSIEESVDPSAVPLLKELDKSTGVEREVPAPGIALTDEVKALYVQPLPKTSGGKRGKSKAGNAGGDA